MVALSITVAILVLLAFIIGFGMGYYFGRAPLVPVQEDENVL